MNTTSISLLERLRQPGEQQAWRRFVNLYTPLLLQWARRLEATETDAADLVQQVFTHLVQELPRFHYDPQKRFRGWLWTVTLNVFRQSRRRATVPLTQADKALAEAAVDDPAEGIAETDYRRYLVGRALKLMQEEFQPTTWKAFLESTTSGDTAAEVAARLGITVDAVYSAKSRVLHRLREELAGLLD
jgi:RNA polymerase sigma-70 factor (ECF subfamily)